MTAVGKTILMVYSLIAVIILMGLSIFKLEKGIDKGIEAIMLLPILVLLANLI